MASGAGDSEDKELTGSPEVQFPDNADALSAMIASIEEKIALCDAVVEDLLAVQKVVKEKGLCDAPVQEQKNQADFTV